MYKVAVVTRTKDRPAFLRRAIESIHNQTYKDFIHVIVNDGGDRSEVEGVVAEFGVDVGDKVKLFHRPESSGAPDKIFNESIDRVDSEYVVVHDDDDTWHPEFLERAVKVLDDGAKGVVVRTDKIIEKVASDTIKQVKTERYQPDVKVISLYRQCVDNQMTPIAFLYRRDVYEEIGKYDDSLPVVGDWEFGIRFLMKYDIEFLDPGFALANYHHRNTGDNSFGLHNHRYYFNQVANRYLRQELTEGKIGPGYIISKVRFEQNFISRMVGRLAPRNIVEKLKKKAG